MNQNQLPLENQFADDQIAQMEADQRPIRFTLPRAPRAKKQFNRLYSSLRVIESYDKTADLTILGSSSVTNATTTTIAITGSPNYLTRLWPDAPQAYLLLHHFSIAATTTGNQGSLQCSFQANGQIVALGDYLAGGNGWYDPNSIIPAPIIDPGNPALGNLVIQYFGGAAPITVSYSIGFSIVYLLPTDRSEE